MMIDDDDVEKTREIIDAVRLDALGLQGPSSRTILDDAQSLVWGERHEAYGHPLDDYSKVALIWTAVLGREVTAKQAALCMIGVKLAREAHKPARDNRVDGAGYWAVADRIERRLAGSE